MLIRRPITNWPLAVIIYETYQVFISAGFIEHVSSDIDGGRERHQAAASSTNDSSETRGAEGARRTTEMEGNSAGTETTHLRHTHHAQLDTHGCTYHS